MTVEYHLLSQLFVLNNRKILVSTVMCLIRFYIDSCQFYEDCATTMKALIQSVNKTKVTGNGAIISVMGPGLLIYLGLFKSDTEKEADYMVDAVLNARLFAACDNASACSSRWSHSVVERGLELTCLAEISLANELKGGTPSFTDAMDIERGQQLYQYTLDRLRAAYDQDKVKQSKFLGPHLVDVHLTNGITVYLETDAGNNTAAAEAA